MSDDTGPPRPAEDSVSLHTIADHDVYYTSQEQVDADFALALSLEDEEQDRAREVSRVTAQAQDRERYRDDEDAAIAGDDDLPPYRDDPGAAFDDPEQQVEVPAKVGRWRRYTGRCARWLGSLKHRPNGTQSRPAKIVLGIAVVLLFFLPLTYAFWPVSKETEPGPTSKERAFENSGSRNKFLVLAKLYPDLEDGTSEECKAAWKKHAVGLRCHEGLLSSVWDKGDGDLVREKNMDIWAYGTVVCDDYKTCETQTAYLEAKIREACTRRTDRFDLHGFQSREAKYFEENEIEDGPLQAAQSLKARYNSLCDRPADRAPYWRQIILGTYAAQLWRIWGIADGKDAARNMRYVDTFMKATSETKTIPRTKVFTPTYLDGQRISDDVYWPERRVGPEKGETTCYHSVVSWLERKMSSFEYGAVLDPKTGVPMGLKDFNNKMEAALDRCEGAEASEAINRTHKMWEQYGWWCNGNPCREDGPISPHVLRLLHGLNKDDDRLVVIRNTMNNHSTTPATRAALQVMHDTQLSMPCGVPSWPGQVVLDIMASDYQAHQYCGNECRNSVDRIQQEHGATFNMLAVDDEGSRFLTAWRRARVIQNLTCTGAEYNDLVTDTTAFCAPGYVAIGRPGWTFPDVYDKVGRAETLAAFEKALEEIESSMPAFVPEPRDDIETQRRLARQLSESVCNKCARQMLVDTKDEVNDLEYNRVMALYSMTCAKMVVGSTLANEPQVRKGLGLG